MKKRNSTKATNWLATAIAAALCCTTVGAQPTTHAEAANPNFDNALGDINNDYAVNSSAVNELVNQVISGENEANFVNDINVVGQFNVADIVTLKKAVDILETEEATAKAIAESDNPEKIYKVDDAYSGFFKLRDKDTIYYFSVVYCIDGSLAAPYGVVIRQAYEGESEGEYVLTYNPDRYINPYDTDVFELDGVEYTYTLKNSAYEILDVSDTITNVVVQNLYCYNEYYYNYDYNKNQRIDVGDAVLSNQMRWSNPVYWIRKNRLMFEDNNDTLLNNPEVLGDHIAYMESIGGTELWIMPESFYYDEKPEYVE